MKLRDVRYLNLDESIAYVFEDAPDVIESLDGKRSLWIDSSGGGEPDFARLQMIAERAPASVTEVRLMPSSRVTEYEWLRGIKSLVDLKIETQKLGNLSQLNGLSALKGLVILAKKRLFEDFDPLKSLPIEFLSVDRPDRNELNCIATNGSIKRFLIADLKIGDFIEVPLPRPTNGSLDLIFLNADAKKILLSSIGKVELDFRLCKKLEEVSIQGAEKVVFSTCKRLNLDALVLPSVREIHLLNGSSISTFGFCAKCPQLQHLIITKCGINGHLQDLKSFNLKTLFVSGVPRIRDKDLQELSGLLSCCYISNGDVCYIDGAQVPVERYYNERKRGRA